MEEKGIGYKLAFWTYCLFMLWLLFGQRMGMEVTADVNLKPFRTIRNYVYVLFRTKDVGLLWHIIVNLVGNVVMFIPLGFLLAENFARLRKFYQTMLFCVLVIVGIEIAQLLTGLGSLDVDDLILNLLGAALGYGFWFFWKQVGKKKGKT